MHLNDQETASIEQLKPVINETRLLASVMVEQPNIQAAISSIEICNGTKSKFESCIDTCEECSTNLGVNHLTYSTFKNGRIIPCRLRDHQPHPRWNDLKVNF